MDKIYFKKQVENGIYVQLMLFTFPLRGFHSEPTFTDLHRWFSNDFPLRKVQGGCPSWHDAQPCILSGLGTCKGETQILAP